MCGLCVAGAEGAGGGRRGAAHHPGVELRANPMSIFHRCHLFEVAFVRGLTRETMHLPLGCLQGGAGVGKQEGAGGALHPQPLTLNPKPNTLNPKPYIFNPKPSTLYPQPYTSSPKL